jgi:hypothetical protein
MHTIVPVFSPILVTQPVLGALQNLGQYIPRMGTFNGVKPTSVPVMIFNPDDNSVTLLQSEDRNLSMRWRNELRVGLDEVTTTCGIQIGTDNEVSTYLKHQMPLFGIQQPLDEMGEVITLTDKTRIQQELRREVKRFFYETFEAADAKDPRLQAKQKLQTTEGMDCLNQTAEQVVTRFLIQVTKIRKTNLAKMTRDTLAETGTGSTLSAALLRTIRDNVPPLTNIVDTTDQQTTERELATAGSRSRGHSTHKN